MLKALKDAHFESKLFYTHPAGYLNLVITLGVYIGMVMASPWVLYQIWLFVAPALYKHERSAITGFLFSTVFLFLGGNRLWLFRHPAVHLEVPGGFPAIWRVRGASDQHQRVL